MPSPTDTRTQKALSLLDRAHGTATTAVLSAPDSPAAFRAATELQEAFRRATLDLAAVRRQVVIDMRRRGFSHAEVAEALGISRGRAQQISQGKGLNPQDPSALF